MSKRLNLSDSTDMWMGLSVNSFIMSVGHPSVVVGDTACSNHRNRHAMIYQDISLAGCVG